MYLSCGTDDFILESTAIFCKQLDALNLDYKYYEGPGAHEWAFWDQEVLKFMYWIKSLRD
jgi:S-formylglutathione hydrolase FrmB